MLDVKGIPKLERLFRLAAQLDVDKSDLQRYTDFVNQKIYDLLLRGEATARANGRDIIQPYDLPITKGLQECVHEFKQISAEIDLQPVLDYLAARPPLDLAYSDETEAELPRIFGGVSVGLARTFKMIDPDLKNPQTTHWEKAIGIFNLLL
jgi:uncharacterized protein DUF1931